MGRFTLILLMVSTLIISCKKHTINQIERSIVDGQWVIFNFTEDGKDLTASGYSEYIFEFSKDGKLQARIPTLGVALAGEWSTYKSEKEVIFELKVVSPLENINEKWIVQVSNKTSISLKATSIDGREKTMVFYLKN